ncbi:signal recognition particle subunit srp68 [Emydomyces testavorans]|uniref:Signal recognition particle subunit SRP68 n=1 Tax=Emydomyces testavorans TaxID=2070801 RepID=A0AAF0DGF1_9EURO|nr:signal recognition particle subunit srp68 [Emydomyces testavorans]
MNITDYIVSQRADALLIGDYNTYRAQLSRRLHTLRKRLGRTTPKGKKYTGRSQVTAEDVAKNSEFVHLFLICAERGWASAMHMRSVHSADPSRKGIAGSTRRHIISRLNKATTYAKELVRLLEDQPTTGTSSIDLLEARAYLASLCATFWMEKQRWEQCLRQNSLARVIYTAVQRKTDREVFRDLLSGTIDPGIRYAAYQLQIPRSTPLNTISIQHFPGDAKVRAEVEAVDPESLCEKGGENTATADRSSQDLPETITWRSRTVKLEDASIAQALGAAAAAESQLSTWMSSPIGQNASHKEKAANYDNVIIASQDAVDATKTAIDELSNEGVDQGDRRMQALQVTRTAVNYALVGWRVGRNRVLCGSEDGLHFTPEKLRTSKRLKTQQDFQVLKDESTGQKLARLRERVVLYDSSLQSLDSVRELPGVAGDIEFMKELDAIRHYFLALRSHTFLSNTKNALALFVQASALTSKCLSVCKASASNFETPLRLDVSEQQAKALSTQLQQLICQYRGIVEIEKLSSETTAAAECSALPSLLDRLGEYPPNGPNLSNLVSYPPKIEPVPVKPLFLDVAWNYIDYPREAKRAVDAREPAAAAAAAGGKPEAKKKGWFGFGR